LNSTRFRKRRFRKRNPRPSGRVQYILQVGTPPSPVLGTAYSPEYEVQENKFQEEFTSVTGQGGRVLNKEVFT